MPAYPVQKKRKLSNEASEPTALQKKKIATKAGKTCEHPCCVKAEKDGKVCEKCNKAD